MGLGFSMSLGFEAFPPRCTMVVSLEHIDPIQVGMACSTDGRKMPKPESPVNQNHKPLSLNRFTAKHSFLHWSSACSSLL